LMGVVANELNQAPYFVMDNLSDAVTLSYARQFIEKSKELIIICEEMKSDSLGSLLPILNQCVKRADTKLMCVGESKFLTPFIKMMKGGIFETEHELIVGLKSRPF
jgi:hypothetical protein